MTLQNKGFKPWWVQRLGAVCMLLFVLLLFGTTTFLPLHTYVEWRSFMQSSVVVAATLIFFAALLSHVWVGLRDVLLDYARPALLRNLLLTLLAASLLGLTFWLIRILLRTQA